jgi:ubiquinone/menaquinone biosynthesis C-methylase UbiE
MHEERTMNRRDFFNSRADTWDDRCRYDHDKINEILDMLSIRMGDAVLDVGAGTGILIPFLLDRIGEIGTITAIDMAENMIRIAGKKFDYENVRFVAADVFTADLPSSAFDVIICYSVFPHFDDKKDAVRLLVRYLKADGVIAICHSQGRDQINSRHKNKSHGVAHDHLPTSWEIEEHLDAAGCETDRLLDTNRLFVVVGRKRHSGDYVTEV